MCTNEIIKPKIRIKVKSNNSSIPTQIDNIEKMEEDNWLEIPESFKMSKYMITTSGKLWSKHKTKIMNGSINKGGYKKIHITYDDGTSKSVLLHRLLGQIFIPNPEGKNSIDHIDRNRLNNHINNLRWASNTEQSLNQTKPLTNRRKRKVLQYDLDGTLVKEWDSITEASKYFGGIEKLAPISRVCRGERETAYGFNWKYPSIENIPDETWHKIPKMEKYYASNKGRIKKVYGMSEKLLIGCINGGYLDVYVNKKNHRLHSLICTTFNGPKPEGKYEVNHIDGNCLNNNPSNLEWTTHVQNVQHAHRIGLINNEKNAISQQKKVQKYTLDGIYICDYSSIKEAGMASNTRTDSISRVCCGKNKTAGGFKWKFVTDNLNKSSVA